MSGDRAVIGRLLDELATGWATGDLSKVGPAFDDRSRLISAQHGTASGTDAILAALGADTRDRGFIHRATNRYIGIDGNRAATSFYLFGLMHDGRDKAFLFGTTIIALLERVESRWRIDDIRIQAMWSKGDPQMASHWLHFPGDRGWQLGAPPPVIVSELHAPWHVLPDLPAPDDLQEALHELYARYAFAVDQNDIGLLVSAYAKDVEGGFAPLGNLSGRDEVVGMLKNFRHLAPFWQHFGEVVAVQDEGDGQHARLIIGRIVPDRPVDESGRTIYAAHYQLRAVRKGGNWHICWSDYRPGWFTQDTVPAFDIGRPTS
ncbi:hypothetical protein D6851_07125 [Altericroceibacterium spongiae]|uniref:SnoaL-like domain-containing protein n=1 Tax=Altericroceibacterium spongiae TaxID=2320269 RepID=A0A420EM47_9SPHN|nr:nuclear transport factor 2 family protein [Altericroceibacterium spongiae]RKF21785.1 hypothetical protein D6851_07125 [Altericroceibacterium spongiae]